MLTHKPVLPVLIIIVMVGFSPFTGWAGPLPLTDDELDSIYAQGIFVDIDISISLPGGGVLSMPSVNIPFPDVGGITGSLDSGTNTVSVVPNNSGSNPVTGTSGNSTPAANGDSGSSSVSGNTSNVLPVAAGVSISDTAMQGNSGLIINAPAAAVSMVINVAVFNNSVLNGDFMQTASSIPTTVLMSFTTFIP